MLLYIASPTNLRFESTVGACLLFWSRRQVCVSIQSILTRIEDINVAGCWGHAALPGPAHAYRGGRRVSHPQVNSEVPVEPEIQAATAGSWGSVLWEHFPGASLPAGEMGEGESEAIWRNVDVPFFFAFLFFFSSGPTFSFLFFVSC